MKGTAYLCDCERNAKIYLELLCEIPQSERERRACTRCMNVKKEEDDDDERNLII
jgi:hypothetical protein